MSEFNHSSSDKTHIGMHIESPLPFYTDRIAHFDVERKIFSEYDFYNYSHIQLYTNLIISPFGIVMLL